MVTHCCICWAWRVPVGMIDHPWRWICSPVFSMFNSNQHQLKDGTNHQPAIIIKSSYQHPTSQPSTSASSAPTIMNILNQPWWPMNSITHQPADSPFFTPAPHPLQRCHNRRSPGNAEALPRHLMPRAFIRRKSSRPWSISPAPQKVAVEA